MKLIKDSLSIISIHDYFISTFYPSTGTNFAKTTAFQQDVLEYTY